MAEQALPAAGDMARLAAAVGRVGSRLLRWQRELQPTGRQLASRRDYAPGDDYRLIDWPLCARRDELLTRCYSGTSDRRYVLWIDCSASMTLGQPSKAIVARRLAWTIGSLLLERGDAVSVAAFADRAVAQLPPLRGKSQQARLRRWLKELPPTAATTDFHAAFATLARCHPAPGPTIILSDFFDAGDVTAALARLWRQHRDPRLVQILSRADVEGELPGDATLADVESGAAQEVVLTEHSLREYRRLVGEHCAALRAFARQRGLEWTQIRTDWPWPQTVRAALLLPHSADQRGAS